ncbi:RNA polymerase sigma factor [Kordia zhangzhouensis]|uniref:RNA polymerase sigma factor n=1 Tax=Kordia zhangzhouensis TaxID=1620405 RepID=UPI0006292899|nr:RNA polymerase sigma factor [Kordia zhangzhouensis]
MHKNDHTEASELVRQYVLGNSEALTQLVKRFHKRFCNHAYYIVKDVEVAKDIAQDSWNVIMNKISKLQDPTQFKSWSLRIVHRKAIDWTRNRLKQQQQNDAYQVTKTIHELPSTDYSQVKQQLRSAIQELSIHHQQVIRLFYVDEYSLKDIANTLQISEGTAKSRLFHAREQLKKQLKK